MPAEIRPYHDDDFDAVWRIWREIGWIGGEDADRRGLTHYLGSGAAEVAVVDGAAECLTHRTPGTITYDSGDLPFCAVTGVTTSLVGRKQGLAQRLTARALQHGHADGAAVAGLGIFDQGFYDLVGFGTSSYDHSAAFDPATLQLDHVAYRAPARVGVDHHVEVHEALAGRRRSHGSITLDPPGLIAAELEWTKKLVGLGYRDADGRLTHGFWGSNNGEHGPLTVHFLAYENVAQLLEVLRSIRELGDQVHSVRMMEPAHVQLQTLLREPMRQRSRSAGSPHESAIRSVAWVQLRMLDVGACAAARWWPGPEIAFNLELHDPLADRVEEGWRGVGGAYTVVVGEESSADGGHAPGLPVLTCDVGAFTRLWFGVAPASTLVASDQIDGPAELLMRLDEAFRLPPLRAGWPF